MTQSPETRLSLIGRLQNGGDSQAWEEFVQIYEPLVHRIAARRGLQYADAAEVTQEVFGRVARAIESWDPDPAKGKFRGWLYRITRNLTIDRLRLEGRQPGSNAVGGEFNLKQVAAPSPDESQEFQIEYERQLFNWAAAKIRPTFKPVNWRAFWLTTVEGRSIEDVAEQTGLQRSAIYVARSRVMARIAAVVKTRLDESIAPDD